MAGDAIMDIDVASATRIAGYRHMTGLVETYTGPDDPRLTFSAAASAWRNFAT